MKIIFSITFLLLLGLVSSCDPDVPGEGINLPTMEFGLTVSPDTAYIILGDTVTLKGSISSTLSDGTKIEDGEAKINLFFGYVNQIPITSFSFEEVTNDIQCKFLVQKGGIEFMKNENKILNIYAIPYGDSIQLEIAFVPQKKGTYTFYIQSMFYEGSKGKTRTGPWFNTPNHFDELWELDDSEIDFKKQYLFAVTD